MSILFSKVELYGGNGLECEFFTGGIPQDYDDLEEADDFQEHMDLQLETVEMTVHTVSYLYGEGETENADEEQLSEIKKRFEEPEWAENLNLIEENYFSFEYDADELYGLDDEDMDDMEMGSL